MTRLAREYNSLNLAQGFPNFPAPDALKEAAVRAIRGDINQYAITWGAHRLRAVLARTYSERYGLDADPEREITVTCGATEAMIATLLALVNPGEEVVVFEPFYENYGPDTILADAKPVYVPLEPGDPRSVRGARRPRGDGRDLRAHPLRRRARAHRHSPWDARAHDHHQRRVQDLQRDRMAGRL